MLLNSLTQKNKNKWTQQYVVNKLSYTQKKNLPVIINEHNNTIN